MVKSVEMLRLLEDGLVLALSKDRDLEKKNGDKGSKPGHIVRGDKADSLYIT
jgi:hypothetical protein